MNEIVNDHVYVKTLPFGGDMYHVFKCQCCTPNKQYIYRGEIKMEGDKESLRAVFYSRMEDFVIASN